MRKPLYKIDSGSEVKATGLGYIYVTTTPDHPGKRMKDHDKTYVYKHVVVMENHLGRPLKKWEIVHHKDDNPANNLLSNLELTTQGEHARGHGKVHKYWKKSPLTKPGAKRVAARYLAIQNFR
jgi:hypothetical protein